MNLKEIMVYLCKRYFIVYRCIKSVNLKSIKLIEFIILLKHFLKKIILKPNLHKTFSGAIKFKFYDIIESLN